MWSYNYRCPDTPDEFLEHHGILGQKWGVRRFQNTDGTLTIAGKRRLMKSDSKTAYNEKLVRKENKLISKADRIRAKSEQAHAKYDLKSANIYASKASHYDSVANKMIRKANSEQDEYKKSRYMLRASKYQLKSSLNNIESDRIAKSTPYGEKAMKLSIKSDKILARAAKVRKEIAKNESYISFTKKSIKDKEYVEAISKAKSTYEKMKKDSTDKVTPNAVSASAVKSKAEYAKKLGKYDMEFLERNLDTNERTGELLKGKELDAAYEKFLKQKYESQVKETP